MDPLDHSSLHHTLILDESTKHIPQKISPPKDLPKDNKWTYQPPPIFCSPTTHIQTAVVLQDILNYGLIYQIAQTGAQHPFLTSYEGILKLETNLPTLTHFTLDNKTQKTYDKHKQLLNDLRQRLKTDKF